MFDIYIYTYTFILVKYIFKNICDLFLWAIFVAVLYLIFEEI